MAEARGREIRIEAPAGSLAALRIDNPGRPRVLALHGWLDNAGSFFPLVDALPDYDWLLLDLGGHGRSDHRAAGNWYPFADFLLDILAALDEVGWKRCIVLGHSMGGALGSMLAAVLPERVEALVTIDALGPLAAHERDAAEQLRRALQARREPPAPRRVFADRREPRSVRMRVNGLSERAAELLLERGLVEVDGGLIWSSDPRLQTPSPSLLAEHQVHELLRAIEAPTLVLLAEPGDPRFGPAQRQERMDCLRNARVQLISGHHHLHMDSCAAVAAAMLAFFEAQGTGAVPTEGASG